MNLDLISTFSTSPFGTELTVASVCEQLGNAGHWENRYRTIIQLGKKIPPLKNALKTDDHLVHGCESQVWLYAELDVDKNEMLFAIDSDARIVKGLIALALAACHRQTPEHITGFDFDQYFASMNLGKHLSPSRSNGLKNIVEKIQQTAQATITL